MQPQDAALSDGRPPSPAVPIGARSELDGLRSACRRHAHVIQLLSASAPNLRSGAAALRAENAELRAANERMAHEGSNGAARGAGALEACLPLDANAPAAARTLVERLRGRVQASVLEDALLIASELVTNSVCHSGASARAVVVVRVLLTGTMVRLEVEDPGRGGVIAPRAPDLGGGGGFGLNIVGQLSERWGLERVAAGGTRVWAQLSRAPARASRFRTAGDPLEVGSRPAGGRSSRAARPRAEIQRGMST